MENTDFVIEHIDEEVQVIADQPSEVTNYPANTDFFIENIDSNVISIAHSLNIEASEVDFRPANTDFFIENIDKNVIAIAESMNLSPSEVDFRPANTDFFVENIDKNLIKIAESLSLTPYEVTIRPANTDMFIENIDKNVTLIKGSTNVVTVSGEYININLPDGGKVQSAQLDGNATQDGTPTPDTPQPISVVTGENVVKVVGKNLLKQLETVTSSGISATYNADGSLRLFGTTTTTWAINAPWQELYVPAGTYTFSIGATLPYRATLRLEHADGSTSNFYINSGASSATLTLNSPAYRVRFASDLMTNATAYDNTIYPQLELGNQATEYQAYTEQDYTISLGTLELAKIPSTDYRDKILYDKTTGKWYVEKQVGKVVLDGTQELTLRNTSANNTYTYSMNTPLDYKTESSAKVISDHFVGLDTVQGVSMMYNATRYLDVLGISLYYNPTNPTANSVYINSNVQLPTWLSTHPTTVYYALATQTTTEITNQTLIDQLEALASASLNQGVNNIFTEIATGNAMPTLKLVIEKY